MIGLFDHEVGLGFVKYSNKETIFTSSSPKNNLSSCISAARVTTLTITIPCKDITLEKFNSQFLLNWYTICRSRSILSQWNWLITITFYLQKIVLLCIVFNYLLTAAVTIKSVWQELVSPFISFFALVVIQCWSISVIEYFPSLFTKVSKVLTQSKDQFYWTPR